MLGDWQDPGLWATGNAWAAAGELHSYSIIRARADLQMDSRTFAGMTRVLATMKNSQYANQFSNEIHDLESWTREILVASFATLQVCFRFHYSSFAIIA